MCTYMHMIIRNIMQPIFHSVYVLHDKQLFTAARRRPFDMGLLIVRKVRSGLCLEITFSLLVFPLKIHKTGSSTVQSLLFHMGERGHIFPFHSFSFPHYDLARSPSFMNLYRVCFLLLHLCCSFPKSLVMVWERAPQALILVSTDSSGTPPGRPTWLCWRKPSSW